MPTRQGILMKAKEDTRGVPLADIAVKVTDGFFLVGLNNVEANRVRNIQLLKERTWFDIPLVSATSAVRSSPSRRARRAKGLQRGLRRLG